MENELIKQDNTNMETLANRVNMVKEQIQAVDMLMKSTMIPDEHYGIIPGTQKPSLLKSGAEKLCTLFQIAPEYKVDIKYINETHREYIITCKLVSRTTGAFFGEGIGSCSTMEKKFRWRNDYTNTGRPVPKSYWDKGRDPSTIGGKGFVAKKDENGVWMIFESSGQVENPDMADTYNTVLKIGKKRALVDAVLTATGASDIFTQDLEENRINDEQKEKVVIPEKTNQQKWDELPEDIKTKFEALAVNNDIQPRIDMCAKVNFDIEKIRDGLNKLQEKRNQDSKPEQKELTNEEKLFMLSEDIKQLFDAIDPKSTDKKKIDWCKTKNWNESVIRFELKRDKENLDKKLKGGE